VSSWMLVGNENRVGLNHANPIWDRFIFRVHQIIYFHRLSCLNSAVCTTGNPYPACNGSTLDRETVIICINTTTEVISWEVISYAGILIRTICLSNHLGIMPAIIAMICHHYPHPRGILSIIPQ
jgi:hypothetical protein